LRHFLGLFLKILERKNGLGTEKIKLTAGQARKTKCYLPHTPFGEATCQRIRLLTSGVAMPY
jgi:hypothetical protein